MAFGGRAPCRPESAPSVLVAIGATRVWCYRIFTVFIGESAAQPRICYQINHAGSRTLAGTWVQHSCMSRSRCMARIWLRQHVRLVDGQGAVWVARWGPAVALVSWLLIGVGSLWLPHPAQTKTTWLHLHPQFIPGKGDSTCHSSCAWNAARFGWRPTLGGDRSS